MGFELFLLLGLGAIGLGAFMSDDEEAATDDEETPTGEEIDISESGADGSDNAIFFTGDNNDTVTSSADILTNVDIQTGAGNDIVDVGDTAMRQSSISTGDGDDVINAPVAWEDVDIDAGNGNDTVVAAGSEGAIFGGDGDDVITMTSSLYDSNIDGGAGNDILNLDARTSDHGGRATGGLGDDVLNILAANKEYAEDNTSIVSGGEGMDTFNIQLSLNDYELDPDSPETDEDFQGVITIGDFDPSEDTLLVDLSSIADASLLNTSLSEASEFSGSKDLTLTFLKDDGTEQSAVITLADAEDVELSDIQIIEPDADPETDADEGEEIVIDDEMSSLIATGSGDDTITGTGSDLEISSGGGADTVVVSVENTTVEGGAGNDVLDVDSYSSTVNGGEGDDTLAGSGERFSWNGGGGDDHITLDGNTIRDEAIFVNGGEGDDTIVSQFGQTGAEGEVFASYVANTYLSGGEGADQFELEVLEIDPFSDYEGEFATGMVITDFEPGEDLLVIDPYSNINNALSVDAETMFSGIEFEPTEDGEGTYVIFNYYNADADNDGRVAIRLTGATGVTMDDIELVGGPGSAPLTVNG